MLLVFGGKAGFSPNKPNVVYEFSVKLKKPWCDYIITMAVAELIVLSMPKQLKGMRLLYNKLIFDETVF